MSAYIRKLNDVSGNVIFPATRAEGVYFNDDSALQDYVSSDGVMKKALGDKNGKDISSYVSGLSVSGRTVTFSKGDGTSGTITTQDTTYSVFKAATSSAAGGTGLVPAPGTGKQNQYLRGDGTWATPTNTTYGNATSDTAGLMSAADKSKLDGIATGANKYVHPTYTSKASGLYKVTIDGTGHVSDATAVTKTDITNLGIPSTDTKYSAFGGASADAAGTIGLVPAPAAGSQSKYLRADGTWQSPPNTTYSNATQSAAGLMSSADKTKLDGIAANANNYTHPSYTSKTSGLYKITVDNLGHVSAAAAVGKSDITALGIPGQDTTYSQFAGSSAGLVPAADSGDSGKYLKADGTWGTPTNTTYSVFKAATSSAAGGTGLVPAPAAGKQNQYLRGDGTWATPTNTTYNNATTTTAGLMSSTDKAKLDGIPSNANYVAVDSALSSTSTNPLQNKAIYSALAGKSDASHTHANLTISLNGTQYVYNGGTAKSVSITASSIGAATSGHTHTNMITIDSSWGWTVTDIPTT